MIFLAHNGNTPGLCLCPPRKAGKPEPVASLVTNQFPISRSSEHYFIPAEIYLISLTLKARVLYDQFCLKWQNFLPSLQEIQRRVLRQTNRKSRLRSMSDNENGLSISSASSRRASSESLEDSIRKILNTSDGRVTGFLERYAVMSRGFKVFRFLQINHASNPCLLCGRVSGHCIGFT